MGRHFRSLTEAIDTNTVGGRLIFHIFGALAEFERGLILQLGVSEATLQIYPRYSYCRSSQAGHITGPVGAASSMSAPAWKRTNYVWATK